MRLLPDALDEWRRDTGVSTGAVALTIVGVWLVPGLLSGLESVVFGVINARPSPLWRILAMYVPPWMVYAIATPAILRAGERFRPTRRRWLAPLAAHLALALVTGAAYSAVAASSWKILSSMSGQMPWPRALLFWFLSSLPVMALAYGVSAAAGRALSHVASTRRSERRAAAAESQLAEARFRLLQGQLHPHFLFNTLNAVMVAVRDGANEEAERALELLSELLRSALREPAQLRPFHEELDFARRYLAIEQIRFGERLRVVFDVTPAVEDVLVPAMLLQPLVENAVRHGISPAATGGSVIVRAGQTPSGVRIEVVDDGVGPAAGYERGTGLGNTAERLAVLYGERATLTLERSGDRTVAAVELPRGEIS